MSPRCVTTSGRLLGSLFMMLLCTTASELIAQKATDSTEQNCTRKGIERTVYRRLLNEHFASLLSPQSPNTVGNFGAYESKDGQITFAGSSIWRSGVLAIKASGSGADGILGLRGDGKVNSKVSVDAQFHLLSRRHTSLTYTYAACEEYDRAVRKALQDFRRRDIQFDSSTASKAAKRSLLKLRADSITRAAAIQKDIDARSAAEGDRLHLDSLRAEQALANETMRTTALDTVPATLSQRLASGNQRATELIEAQRKLDIVAFHLSWWTVALGFTNNSFKLFDSTAALSSQLSSKAYLSPEVRVQYSVYSLPFDTAGAWYLSIGARASRSDNFGALKKMELTDTKQFGPNARDRERTTKITAYAGDYHRDLKALDVFADWYSFILADNAAAIHVYPSVVMKDKEKGVTNLGLGFVALYKNDKGTANLVNAEVYYEFNDLWSVQESELSLWKRGTLGFRFTLPITFSVKE